MNALATYIHHLDPVLWDIPGTPLAVRWYGLAYVAAFITGYLVLLWQSKRSLYCVQEDKLGDFATGIAIFGVLMGGRLGEFFFYWLPENGLSGFLSDPTWVFRVWEGGMASHGGILGVMFFAMWYARKHKLPTLAVFDGIVVAAPLGLFFGRIANFINGELYGRAAEAGSAIAMKFPLEIYSFTAARRNEVYAAVLRVSPEPIPAFIPGDPGYSPWQRMIELCQSSDAVRETLGQFLTPRYPSQLFEALGEGLLPFLVLIALRFSWKSAPAGIFSAIFAFMYAAARICCECIKEPDAPTWGAITRGQYLTFIIIALGVLFLVLALRNRKQAVPTAAKNAEKH